MKAMELQKQLVQVTSQHGMKERQKRKNELTVSELSELPAETRLYRAVGKTCVFSIRMRVFSVFLFFPAFLHSSSYRLVSENTNVE